MERVGATESSQHICFVNLGRVGGGSGVGGRLWTRKRESASASVGYQKDS